MGRPPNISPHTAIQHIRALSSTRTNETEYTVIGDIPNELQCPLCLSLLNDPLELTTCDRFVCAGCCCQWLRVSQSLSCPCCYSSHLTDFSTIKTPSAAISVFIGTMKIKCLKCQGIGEMKNFTKHLSSKCRSHFENMVTIKEVLQKPHNSPLTQAEEVLKSSLVRRSLSSSSSIELNSQGKKITLVKVTNPRLPSSEASPRTLRRRSSELRRQRQHISGGDDLVQLASEFKLSSREQRKALVDLLMKQGEIKIAIPVREALAMKTDLHLSYLRLRDMRRWVKQWGIKIASEKRMRVESLKYCGENLRSELVPFSFPLHDGQGTMEVKNRPMAYVPDLWQKISDMLNMNDSESDGVHQLTWHEGRIPPDEVWVKIGGDKGGESFKMSFQVVNTFHPNSPSNTCVFCVYEAPDSPANLKIALERYRDQVNELTSKQWKGKKIKVFLSGD